MKKSISINGVSVKPGTNTVVNLNIARLPSGTEIDLPVYVYRSLKPGPVILLSGGLHGDEINGIEIVRRMIENKWLENLICGTVIAVPIMNIYGFLNFSREVADGKDANRSFPGSTHGSLASRVAYYLTKTIIKEIDLGIDFHTGGASRYNFPQLRIDPTDQRAVELGSAFQAPLVLQSKLIKGSLRHQAHKMGKSIVVFEGGESQRLDEEIIKQGIAGARRVLKQYGLVKDAPLQPAAPLHCESSTWIRARRSGLFSLVVKSGTMVEKNQLLGFITDPFGQFKTKVSATHKGFVLGHNNLAVIQQGQALFHLGFPKEA